MKRDIKILDIFYGNKCNLACNQCDTRSDHIRGKGVDDPEMTELFNENKGYLRAMVQEVYEQECDWCDYLFKDGSMVGLNSKILKSYVEHRCNVTLNSIGLEPLTDLKSDPLPWMDSYTQSNNKQVAPQESEISSYMIGAINKDVDINLLKNFDL